MQTQTPNLWRRIRAAFQPSKAVALGVDWDTQSPMVRTDEGYGRTSASGTEISYGQITGKERNTALTGEQWYVQAEDMIRQDAMVRLAVEGYLQTIRSADWRWRAADESPRALFFRDFFDDMWARQRYGWQDQQLSYLARYALTGFRYAEQIDAVKRGIDGQLRTMVDFFADCEPSAHYRWVSDDGGRTLSAVEQIDRSGGYGNLVGMDGKPLSVNYMPTTDASRILLLTHGQTGTNWGGDGGILRSVWGAWKDKAEAMNAQSVGLSRFGAPTPHVRVDEIGMANAGYNLAQIEQAKQAAWASAQQWAVGGSTAVMSNSYITIEFIGGVFDASQCNDTIRQRNDEIVSGLMQPFLGMGLGDSAGSRALSTQSASHFDVWAENIADNTASQINGEDRPGAGVVGRIMAANGWASEMSLAPSIEHTGLRTDDFKDLAGTLSAWASTGLLKYRKLAREAMERMGMQPTDADLDELAASVQPAGNGGESPAGRAGPGRPGLEGGAEDPEPNRKPRTVTT